MVLPPRHRVDCAEFFVPEHLPARMQLDAPRPTIDEIEHAAAKAGRTWNDQLTYVMEVCLGKHAPDFDDGRSTEDWRTLMSPCRLLLLGEGEDWFPCPYLWGQTR